MEQGVMNSGAAVLAVFIPGPAFHRRMTFH